MKNILKELQDGNVVIGTICNIEHPQVIELMGYTGWDYVLINLEDNATSPYGGSFDNLVRALMPLMLHRWQKYFCRMSVWSTRL